MPGDTDFRRQLQVIEDSRVDAIVLWTDIQPAAIILKEMQELGMKQHVFGSHRTISEDLIKLAGSAADGFEAVYPYDPTRNDPGWVRFNAEYEARFHEKPDHFAALAYDQMQILLEAICRAGLNKGRIRDALTAITSYKGVTGEVMFDPNCKNIAPMFLARVHDGAITYRRITMEKPYARVGEDGVQYSGPSLPNQDVGTLAIAVFGPHAEELINSLGAPPLDALRAGLQRDVAGGGNLVSAHEKPSLIAIPSDTAWGKSADELVKAVYDRHVLAIIALDRKSSHLAEQLGVKAFVPVIAISSDRMPTTTNIPWIFRLPEGTSLQQAFDCVSDATARAGANREKLRDILASGTTIAGVRFDETGEAQ